MAERQGSLFASATRPRSVAHRGIHPLPSDFSRPFGGSEQANAISLTFSPSKIGVTEGFVGFLRLRTVSKPSSTSCWRVRYTVVALVSNASMIRLSIQPSPSSETSAFSRMRAFISFCAELFPLRIISSTPKVS